MYSYYENFKAACRKKGTTITTVLKAIGRSTSCTGGWAHGQIPGLDITFQIANYLGISVEELALGEEQEAVSPHLSASDREWLDIISRIPVDRQEMCKSFLKTHMVEPGKYSDKMNA